LEAKANGYIIENYDILNQGDGLFFINGEGEADGAQINIIVNDVVVFNSPKVLVAGTDIYRNSDAEFNKLVEQEKSAIRKIGVVFTFSETENGFLLKVVDEDGHQAEQQLLTEKIPAKNEETALAGITTNLSKTGNTVFIVDDIELKLSGFWFLPSGLINEIRRNVLDQLMETRIREYVRLERPIEKTDVPYPVKELDFTYNVSNQLARNFYKRHGVTEIEKAFELQWDPGKSRVMTTKYCVKYELGKCARFQRATMGEKVVEPLTLRQGELEYKLKFNCKPCEMEIWEKDAELEFIDEDEQMKV
jgi:putative protease